MLSPNRVSSSFHCVQVAAEKDPDIAKNPVVLSAQEVLEEVSV